VSFLRKITAFGGFWANTGPVLLSFCLLFGAANASLAQDADAPDAQPAADQAAEVAPAAKIEPKPLSKADVKEFEQQLELLELNSQRIDSLEKRVGSGNRLVIDVLDIRLDRTWMDSLELVIVYASNVADKRDKGFETGEYAANAVALLQEIPRRIQEVIDRVSSRVAQPDVSKTAAEQAAIDEQFFAAIDSVIVNYAVLEKAIAVAKRFDIDTSEEDEFLRSRLEDGIINLSVYLDITKAEVAGLRSGVAISPEDAELAAKLAIANARVKKIAVMMERVLPSLTAFEFSTAEYKQQLLSVTGEITTSIFEWEVIVGLVSAWGDSMIDFLIERGPSFVVQLLVFLLIIYVSVKLGTLLQGLIKSGFEKSHNSFSQLLQEMVLSISRNLIILLGTLIALSQIGISLGPLLTGLGIAGFIVGFALQDSLSNFASGMMILFYRPFDVGDTIAAATARGKVSHMSLVNTTIRTFDNQSLIIPNNKIWQDVIVNVTDQHLRRVDMVFGITYDESIDRVEKILREVLAADERVLESPEPAIKVGSFSDSSVDILCRPWVKTDDYWDVLWDTNKAVKAAFDREGVVIPFPQRDVHIFQDQSSDKDS
jgi:small conductance mechanosensitive channel